MMSSTLADSASRSPSRLSDNPSKKRLCLQANAATIASTYTYVWRLGTPGDAALTAVSVFDSRCANIHVEETNDLAYTPFPLKLLASLAQLCRSVKDKLAGEISTIKARTPQAISVPTCSPTSEVGRLLAGLAAGTDPATVEALATLNQGELDRLAQITADLAGDPARAARQLAALRTKIDNQVASLDRLFSALAPANAERLRQLATAREAAREAAIAASGALFRDEPLPAIGGDAWRGLAAEIDALNRWATDLRQRQDAVRLP